MTKLPYVKEKNFFKIAEGNDTTGQEAPRLPMTPWVIIQFRTSVVTDNKTETLENFVSSKLGSYDINTDSQWETVSFRMKDPNWNPKANFDQEVEAKGTLAFDNLFEGIDITDNGGIIKASLKLYDKNFGDLESIIMRSIAAMKLGDEYHKSENTLASDDTYMLEFKQGGPQNINIRLRFGYADPYVASENIIDDAFGDSTGVGKYSERTEETGKNKMVIKTPWLFFQMMNAKFAVVDAGLNAVVDCISIGGNFLDKLKIVKRFSMFKGTPRNVLRQFAKEMFRASGGKISVADDDGGIIYYGKDGSADDGKDDSKIFGDDGPVVDTEFKSDWCPTWQVVTKGEKEDMTSDEISLDHHNFRVEVMYGAAPTPQYTNSGKLIPDAPTKRSYMSIKSLLNTFCQHIPPRYYIEDEGELIIVKDPDDIKIMLTGKEDPAVLKVGTYKRGAIKPIPYTYATKEVGGEGGRSLRVRFFYKEPSFDDQKFVRLYTWRNNRNNLISSFSINSTLDFAQMSQRLAIINTDKPELLAGAPSSTVNDNNSSGLVATDNQISTKEAFSLVTNVIEQVQGDESENGMTTMRSIANNMIAHLNSQTFKGSIEIPGDPFYLFLDKLQPYQYGIWINVLRDRNYNWSGLDDPHQVSYMSGFYLISGISHSINSSGFKTTLQVSKWPTQTIGLEGSNDTLRR